MFVAIYSQDPYPQEEERIVNQEFLDKKDCLHFLKSSRSKCSMSSFWNSQIYDKQKEEYINLTKEELDYIWN